MARKSFKVSDCSNMLLTLITYTVLEEFAVALPSSRYSDFRQSRSLEKPTSTSTDRQAVRLHPGVIASVVIVTLVAAVAAVFIIRKYCCPQSNATYRYSELQQLEEQNRAAEEDNDSDEDLLE